MSNPTSDLVELKLTWQLNSNVNGFSMGNDSVGFCIIVGYRSERNQKINKSIFVMTSILYIGKLSIFK